MAPHLGRDITGMVAEAICGAMKTGIRGRHSQNEGANVKKRRLYTPGCRRNMAEQLTGLGGGHRCRHNYPKQEQYFTF